MTDLAQRVAAALGDVLHEHDPELAHPDCTDECVARVAVAAFKGWLQEQEERLAPALLLDHANGGNASAPPADRAVEAVVERAIWGSVLGSYGAKYRLHEDARLRQTAGEVVSALRQALSGPHGREVAEGLGMPVANGEMCGDEHDGARCFESAGHTIPHSDGQQKWPNYFSEPLFRLPREGDG